KKEKEKMQKKFGKNKKNDKNNLNAIDAQEDSDEENKNGLVYLLSNIRVKKSLFLKTGMIGSQKLCVLIDTGADISVAPLHFKIPRNESAIVNVRMKSACGTVILAHGRAKRQKLNVMGLEIDFEPILIDTELDYIILGADVIRKVPEILTKCIQDLQSHRLQTIADESKTAAIINDQFPDYKDIFKNELDHTSTCKSIKHDILVENTKPIYCKPARIPMHCEEEVDKMVQNYLKNGIIRPSNSPWNSRLRLVPKKDGKIRVCLDFRPLNLKTIKDRYPLPRIDEILDKLNGASVFSTLDATSGYFQIEMTEKSKPLTAFSYKRGHYEFNKMAMGLCNAPATFQRLMDSIFPRDKFEFVLPYLDDLIVFSKNEADHKKHLKLVFEAIKKANIVLKESKCQFFKDELLILGNRVSKGIIRPDPAKIKTIRAHSLPGTVKDLRSFLGLVNFCREYLPHLTEMAHPLYSLLCGKRQKSDCKITHTAETKQAFLRIKEAIVQDLVKAQPSLDKPFILTTDASEHGIGAILSQTLDNGKEMMVSAFSKSLEPAQKNYATTDKELLAIVKAFDHFRHYLLGKEFLLRTDHKSLTYLHTCKNPTSRMLRWALRIQEYQFKVEYLEGPKNFADSCSRINLIKMPTKSTPMFDSDDKMQILKNYHESLGHGSANNMSFAITKRYQWQNMHDDIINYCKQCIICQKEGYERLHTKNKVIETERSGQIWEIDLIGSIRSKKKKYFIFMAIDHHSKWIETKVIPNKTPQQIQKAIREKIFENHGKPEMILSDCGKEFIAEEMEKFFKMECVNHQTGSPYHHQTTGAVERVNLTFMNKLRKLSHFKRDQWKEKVEVATLAVNLSFHRALGTSPYIWRYKMLPELEVDDVLGQTRIFVNEKDLVTKRATLWRKYKRNIIKGSKEIRDHLSPEEKVFIYRPRKHKMDHGWQKGYRVVKTIGSDAYLV
ncbi:putative LTR retrotransposon, partial [Pseudoloma neurophilia]